MVCSNAKDDKGSKKVTSLKQKINKRKYDQALTTLDENTELGRHNNSEKKYKNSTVESIIPMKLFMKPVVRIERSREAEDFLHQTKNIDVTEEEKEMTFNDENENHLDTKDDTDENVEEDDEEYIKVENVFEDEVWDDVQDSIHDNTQDEIQNIQDEAHQGTPYEVIPQKNMGLWRNGGG